MVVVEVNGYTIGPRADLTDADLTGVSLRSADLRGADLRGAILINADLRRAKLNLARLDGADLSRANLYWADLEEANLSGANLTDTALYGANLAGAYLPRANLTGANLAGACLQKTNLTEANLTGAVLTGALLQPTFDGFIIADESTIWPAGFDPGLAWADGAVIQRPEALGSGDEQGDRRSLLLLMALIDEATKELRHSEASLNDLYPPDCPDRSQDRSYVKHLEANLDAMSSDIQKLERELSARLAEAKPPNRPDLPSRDRWGEIPYGDDKPDSEQLNRMMVEIAAGYKYGDPRSRLPKSRTFKLQYRRIAAQMAEMKANGIAIEIPPE